MSSTILIVEADTATATFLCDQLAADDYTPAAVSTVEGARQAAAELAPQLLVLGELRARAAGRGPRRALSV